MRRACRASRGVGQARRKTEATRGTFQWLLFFVSPDPLCRPTAGARPSAAADNHPSRLCSSADSALIFVTSGCPSNSRGHRMNAFRIAAITDEFSPDLDIALKGMADVGMTGAELRVISGKNMIDLPDDEVDRVRKAVEARGMTVISLASPLLKCVLPGVAAARQARAARRVRLAVYLRGSTATHAPCVRDRRANRRRDRPRVLLLAYRRAGAAASPPPHRRSTSWPKKPRSAVS